MKAFNMIFLAAYAFCICLQTEVLGNNVDGLSPGIDDYYRLTEQKRQECEKIYPDNIICDTSLDYSGFFNFPAYLFQTEETSSKECNVRPNPDIYRSFTNTFEKYGITLKNYYWAGNDKCLSLTVQHQAKQHDIKVIYNKKHFEDLFLKQHLSASEVVFKDNTPAFARIINFNLNWKNPAKTLEEKKTFTTPWEFSSKMTFLVLKPEIIFERDGLTAAKVSFAGDENLFALFIHSRENFNFSQIYAEIQKSPPADDKTFVQIPMGSALHESTLPLPRCPFEAAVLSSKVNPRITDIARLEFNIRGFGAKAGNAGTSEKFVAMDNQKFTTFDLGFYFDLMRENENIPIFSAFIYEFKE